LERNVERDRRSIEDLSGKGWQSLVIWECETRDQNALKTRLAKFLR
jgi:DNA mismatch endonuclease (patch repair protein)